MGYIFRGFLTNARECSEVVSRLLPYCEIKHEYEALDGLIVRFPCEDDLHPMAGEDEYLHVLDQIHEAREVLKVISNQFAEDLFVYVDVECFGGTCINLGTHLLNGETIRAFDTPESEVDLEELLRPLRVQFGPDQHFKPFTRGYFEMDQLQDWPRAPPAAAEPVHTSSEVGTSMPRKSWWRRFGLG
ncbi:hypothetical protein GNX71_24235 [Variovorax sp. RKNM96]|uniref:hypothetical protein n=1 Tax=Variovorax sp. RKNM96 TaxID=2681552 RepID=UPI001980497C|nr:hypothetical protein [Variovorax sp. RKNM96]QSI32521.1 hypothetical protein GNX71_24235 [Variovorax sp. RKNM96]